MKTLRYLDENFEEIILCALIVIITSCTCLQCFMRYVVNHALSWTDELSKYCFVYSGFISIGYCIRRFLMIRIDLIKSLLPGKVFSIISVFVTLVMTTFFILLFKASITTYQDYLAGNMVSPALGIPMYVVYAGAVVGFAIAIFRSIQCLIVHDIPLAIGKEPIGTLPKNTDKGE